MKSEPSREVQELRLAIDRREVELEQALENLVGAAERRASAGYYLGRYPWQVLLGGVVLGAWLGHRRVRARAEER